ncbi:hypothetical protein PAP10c_0453 [Pantoea agglomerans]|nr:hypothetical protein PAP10c_0453 [Pantoea agglomerans]
MNIRQAELKDSFALSALLSELGYGGTESFIEQRLAQLCSDPSEALLVAEHGSQVLGSPYILFLSWRWPVISPASAISALQKVSAVKASASS